MDSASGMRGGCSGLRRFVQQTRFEEEGKRGADGLRICSDDYLLHSSHGMAGLITSIPN